MCRKYVTMCVIPQMVLVYWLWTPRACMMASSRPAHKAGESKIIIYLPIDSNAGWLVLSFSSISKQQHQCSLCMSPVTTSSCIFGLCLMNWLKVEQWYAPPNPDCSILARKIECDFGWSYPCYIAKGVKGERTLQPWKGPFWGISQNNIINSSQQWMFQLDEVYHLGIKVCLILGYMLKHCHCGMANVCGIGHYWQLRYL